MNTRWFRSNSSLSSRPQKNNKTNGTWRRRLLLAALSGALILGIAVWSERSQAASDPAETGNRIARMIRHAGKSLNTALSFIPSAMQTGQGPQFIISTVAGGGYTTESPALQTALARPFAVAKDPLGRGFYILDKAEPDDTATFALLRFVNTSAQPVTLAGVVINPGNVNLIAGGGTTVTVNDTPARTFQLEAIFGLAVDPSGNAVYLLGNEINAIIGLNVSDQNFLIGGKTILPGRFRTIVETSLLSSDSSAHGLALNPATHHFYFASAIGFSSAFKIYEADPAGGEPEAIAGATDDGPVPGIALQTKISKVAAILVETSGNILLLETNKVDDGTVRRVNGTSITTLAQNLALPVSMTIGPDSNIYVALSEALPGTPSIVRINPNGGSPIAVAGNGPCNDISNACGDGGPATTASINIPKFSGAFDQAFFQIAADSTGIWLPSFFNYQRIRYINTSGSQATVLGKTIAAGTIDAIVGSGLPEPYDNGPAIYAEINGPLGVTANSDGNLYASSTGSDPRLRFVNNSQQQATIFQGTTSAQTAQPEHIITVNKNAGINDGSVITSSYGANGLQGLTHTANGILVADSLNGSLYPPGCNLASPNCKRSGLLRFINTSANTLTFFPAAQAPTRVTIPPGGIGNLAGVFVALRDTPITEADGVPANEAAIFVTDAVMDSVGNIYLTDYRFDRIRRINGQTGIIDSLTITTGGASTAAAKEDGPVINTAVAVDGVSKPAGLAMRADRLYIADRGNNRVLRQDAPGSANYTIIADSTDGINSPRDVAVDSAGNVYVVNSGTHQILFISAATGDVTVAAGTGTAGFSGDGGTATQAQLNLVNLTINGPFSALLPDHTIGITVLPNDDVVFADSGNNRLRLLKQTANVAPVLATIADQTMTEGETNTVNFSATDANPQDTLTFTINGNPGFGTFTDNGNGTASLQLAPGFTDAGSYPMSVTVSDGELTDTKSFNLIVNDFNRPPVVTVGTIASPLTATSASGVLVNLTGTVSDPDGDAFTWKWFDGATEIASGSIATADVTVTLALGNHSIFLQATDSKNASTSSNAQAVLVRDTEAPVIGTIPANQEFEGDTLGGKVFNFANPTVTDNLDPNPTLQVTGVPPGNKFPVGITTVTFIASDSSGNTATKSFTVKVNDTQKPTISGVPTNQTFEGDTLGGKVFNFATPTATDVVSGNVIVIITGAPASNLFPVGTTTVNFSATDGAGNQQTASFTVTVTDTTLPVISNVPADKTAEATSAAGAVVTYALPTATDIVSGNVAVTPSQASGTTFPIGMTTVTFTAKDGANNTANASFKVTVQDTTPPAFSNVPTNKIVAAASASGSNVTFTLPTATDLVDGVRSVTSSHASGSLFPVGDTTVTFTAQDTRGNTATTSFVISVVTVPPPTINGVPASVTVEATSIDGAVVNYVMPTAVSGQGAALPVQTSNASGTVFPLGSTTVTFTATDNLGLTSMASFVVTVVDTTPPTINGSTPNITTEAPTPAGANVSYALPTATDLVDGAVSVTTSHPSGSLFPIGTTTVTLTAKDSRMNTATRTFTITVLANVNYVISTFAGAGTYGNSGDNGSALSAQFRQLVALARDPQGRLLTVDSASRTVRRIELNNTIIAIAGNGSSGNGGDGRDAVFASFGIPSGVAVDSHGNIYVSDISFNRVRIITADGRIDHFAGDRNGSPGSTGDFGTAAGARLRQPRGLFVDKNDKLYIADSGNNRIRVVDIATGIINTVAGTGFAGYTGDGAIASTLSLNNPISVAVDTNLNLFIADSSNHRVRRVDGATQIMTTLAGNGTAGFGGDDGPSASSQLSNPTGVAVDGLGNVFIADQNNQRVRRVSKATGKIRTVAGNGTVGFSGDNGPATQAQMSGPADVASDASGDTVYVADAGNLRVRKLSAGAASVNHSPVITSAIGNQTLTTGQTLDLPLTATDEDNDNVVFSLINAPAFASIINASPAQRTATLRLTPTTAGTFSGVQVRADDGKGGSATSSAFNITVNNPAPNNQPPTATAGALPAMIEATSAAGASVNLSGSGSDPDNDPISFTWKDGATVIATTANATVTLGLGQHSITLTVTDSKSAATTTNAQAVLVKDSTPPVINGVPAAITVPATSAAGAVVNYTLPTATDLVSGNVPVNASVASGATFPVGTTTVQFTATDAASNAAMASFTVTVTPFTGGGDCPTGDQSYTISTHAGSGIYGYNGDNGPATDARMRQISDVARDKDGNVYIADINSRVVRRVGTNGIITTIAGIGAGGNTGDGNQATSATFSAPSGVVVDSKGNIYVADRDNNRVRIISNGVINNFAGSSAGTAGSTGDGGNATSARLRQPRGLAVDKDDNLYIADSGNHRIRKVDAVTKVITTVAGNGVPGFSGDGENALTANFNLPVDVAVDATGDLYIADSFNHRIRKVVKATQLMSTVAGTGTGGFTGDNGPATSARLNNPSSIAVDCGGNLYIADAWNNRVRRVTRSSNTIRTIAGMNQAGFSGDGGPATDASLSQPVAVAIDENGNTVFVADFGNQRVRKLTGGNVPPPPQNNPPTIGNIASQTVTVGQTLDVPLVASDPDNGDQVTFSLLNAPAFATLINQNPAQRTATLHIAPTTANQVGTTNGVIVQISDGKGGTGQSNAFSLTVNSSGGTTNRPPTAVIVGGASVTFEATSTAGRVVAFDGTQSSDPDGDALTFQWKEGAIVLGSAAQINTQLSVGSHVITLTVNDGKGGTSTATQTVTINPFVTPDTPLLLLGIDPTAGRQGQTLDVTLTGAGFQPGAVISFSGDGITATVKTLTGNQIVAEVQIALNAPTGSGLSTKRHVIVTNPDGKSAALNRIFAVFPK